MLKKLQPAHSSDRSLMIKYRVQGIAEMENSQRLPSSSSDKEALYAEWEQWKRNEPPGEKRAEAVSRMRECYEKNAKNLDLSSMALSQLPTLPDCVEELVVNDNQLTELPALPSSLKKLSVNDNQLTQLPALPSSLEGLFANDNQLTQLPTLPNFLKMLFATDNQLAALPDILPNSLKSLDVSNNRL
ncbi:invasion plasmid antigen, partial [Candidatus Regiella insecticola LSR1]